MKTKKSFSLDFGFGDLVFLRTDCEIERVVTGVIIRPSGKMYELACGIETTWHQSVEIESCPEVVKVIGFKQ